MTTNMIFGSIFIVLGVLSLAVHIAMLRGMKLPVRLFWKLEKMQESYGKDEGTGMHIAKYVLLPIITGIYLLFK